MCLAVNLGFPAEVVWSVANFKLSCLQRINIRCRIVCPALNLGFAAEVVWSAMNFKLSCLQ